MHPGNTGLTLRHYAGQSRLELVLGLLHLLLVLTLLGRQPADVAVGGLDHGVEVVGVPAVDLAALQPGEENAHRLGELAVIWPKGGSETKRWDYGQRNEDSRWSPIGKSNKG